MPQHCPSVACLKRAAMVWLGLLLAIFIAFLLYDTCKTPTRHKNFYSLCIDILGRLLIFVVCYLLSGVLGCLPLPEQRFLNVIPEPFLLWKFWTWGDQLRQLRGTDDQEICPRPTVQENAHAPPSINVRFRITEPVPTFLFERRSVYPPRDNVPEVTLPLNTASCTSYGSARDNFVFPEFRDGPPKSNKPESKCNQEEITNVRVVSIRNTSNGPNHPQIPWGLLRSGTGEATLSDPIAINAQFGLLKEKILEREAVNAEKKKHKTKERSQTERGSSLPKQRLPSVTEPREGDLRQLREENFAKRSKNKEVRDSAKGGTEEPKNNSEVQIAKTDQCDGASAGEFSKNLKKLSKKEVFQDPEPSTFKCPGAQAVGNSSSGAQAVGNSPSGAQSVGNSPSGAQSVGNSPSGAQSFENCAVENAPSGAQAVEVAKHSAT